MAHDVTFLVPERKLGKVDIEFNVKENQTLVGILKISKGNIQWKPTNWHNNNRITISWKKFDKLMQNRKNS